MSGICGYVRFDGQPASRDELVPMLESIKHCGTGKALQYVSGSAALGVQLHREEIPAPEYDTLDSLATSASELAILVGKHLQPPIRTMVGEKP